MAPHANAARSHRGPDFYRMYGNSRSPCASGHSRILGTSPRLPLVRAAFEPVCAEGSVIILAALVVTHAACVVLGAIATFAWLVWRMED